MRQNLHHHSLFDVTFPASHHGHADAVSVQGKHRVALRHEDRLAAIVRLERVLAVGLADESTFLHLCLQVQAIGIVTGFRQIVVPGHLVHHVHSQHLRRMRIQFQGFENLLERKHLVGMLLEKRLQHFCHLFLVQSLATLVLTHSHIVFSDS